MSKIEKATYIIMTIILVFLIGMMIGNKHQTTRYANVAEVCMVDHDRDLVVCQDSVGHIWEFYGSEDWMVGDCAALVMDDNGTELVIDDTIVNVRYCAWGLWRYGNGILH